MARKAGISGFRRGGVIAVLSSGLLVIAFQACASSPKPADSPTTPDAPPLTATRSDSPAPSESPPSESTVPSAPAPVSESESHHQSSPGQQKDACDGYQKIQEPLARLGVEALKAGRIDPWIYELDSRTGFLRLSESFKKTAVNGALKRVNEDPYAAKILTEAYRELTQPGQCTVCTPTTYHAKVAQEADPKTGSEWFAWEFGGDEQPSDVQMAACFRALYAKVPQGCDVGSYAALDADCMVKKPGFTKDRECKQEVDAVATADARDPASAAAKGCCVFCKSLFYKPSTCRGSCG
jgi:hypothetical protein